METRNVAPQAIEGKAGLYSQRRSSFSSIRSPMKALRRLSISSQISTSSDTDLVSASSERRRSTLQKIRPSERLRTDLDRRPSKASSEDPTEYTSTRPTTPSAPGSGKSSLSGDAAVVVKYGALQEESSLLRTKKAHLVLTQSTLYKFKSRQAATERFPQISVPTNGVEALTPVDSTTSFKDLSAGIEVQVPLENVVAVFRDEGIKPTFGMEIWWKSLGQLCSFANMELNFTHPGDRDDWLKVIHYTIKQRSKDMSEGRTTSDVETDLPQILETKYPQHKSHLEIFPVVPRRPYTRLRSNSGEWKKKWREGSAFYLAFSKNVCMLVQFAASPNGQKALPSIKRFGLVTLAKVNASMADQRFDLMFRLPLGMPKKVELASRHHRIILSRFFKSDTYLKPAWPLWTRREVFLIEGESQQLPLPAGEDYGGFKRTLEAFLDGYHSASVNWKVNWRQVKYPPEFQLLPPSPGVQYTPHQLLAVFRSLRFNDFFKSLSFEGVDFSPLSGVFDNKGRLEPTTWLSRTGKRSLTRNEFEIVERSSLLFQEVVAMLLGSESIRQVNFGGVLPKRATRTDSTDPDAPSPTDRDCDVVPPVILLLRSLQTRCKSIVFNGNDLGDMDVSELYQTLQSQPDYLKGIGLSRCQLDESAMITVWEGIHEQRHSLETLELACNLSCLEAGRVSQTLRDASRLRRLDMSYCLKGTIDGPLFRPWSTTLYSDPWRLEEVNLSGWKINFDTISGFLRYMELDESSCLRKLVLNNCGISGAVATAIFCRVGRGRNMHLHLNCNPLEQGSTDWIDLIQGSEAPKGLHLDMLEFKHESNFNRLLTALADNTTIEFLSLVGTSPAGPPNSKTTELLSGMFEKNRSLRYLDFSGYSGKLEDSHLGWGLFDAMGGLKYNDTLRQLRIRNHDLGAAEDITNICRVIAINKGLVMLDMRGNNLDHHQFSEIIHALNNNEQLVSFPVSEADRNHAVEKEKQLFMAKIKKSRSPLRSLSKADETRLCGLLKWLEDHWKSEVARVTEILARNRDSPTDQLLDLELDYLNAWGDEDLPVWLMSNLNARNRGMGMDAYLTRSDSILSTSSYVMPSSPTQPGSPTTGTFSSALQTYTIVEEEPWGSDSELSPLTESPYVIGTPGGIAVPPVRLWKHQRSTSEP